MGEAPAVIDNVSAQERKRDKGGRERRRRPRRDGDGHRELRLERAPSLDKILTLTHSFAGATMLLQVISTFAVQGSLRDEAQMANAFDQLCSHVTATSPPSSGISGDDKVQRFYSRRLFALAALLREWRPTLEAERPVANVSTTPPLHAECAALLQVRMGCAPWMWP